MPKNTALRRILAGCALSALLGVSSTEGRPPAEMRCHGFSGAVECTLSYVFPFEGVFRVSVGNAEIPQPREANLKGLTGIFEISKTEWTLIEVSIDDGRRVHTLAVLARWSSGKLEFKRPQQQIAQN